jgi:UDPglucose--hexose-1-phosphate uridylyltransferase
MKARVLRTNAKEIIRMSHNRLMPNYSDTPHRRRNALTGDWVLVSPHRAKRPWLGGKETIAPNDRPQYDPTCFLCPHNERVSGDVNPDYRDVYVFDNDFAAILPEPPAPTSDGSSERDSLFQSVGISGECRVICFSPRHDLTLPQMPVAAIRKVVDAWAEQIVDLGAKYTWVQVFENKGEVMGCSNPHPHGQIWSGNFLPTDAAKEDDHQLAYYQANGSPLLVDYLAHELALGTRVVVENDDWVVLVPYWALWPFETILLPKQHVLRLPDLTTGRRDSLAAILKQHLSRYDKLFGVSFPYSMGWHGAPTGPYPGNVDHWQLHAHFYPPLLRSATVKKFMVGYELLAEGQRDLTPEQAAERLAAIPDDN